MSKKEYVLKILDKLQWYRAKEKPIREYLLANDDEEYVNYLYDQFVQAVDSTLKDTFNNKAKSLAQYLDDVKIKESVSRKADEEDLKKLDQLLNSL